MRLVPLRSDVVEEPNALIRWTIFFFAGGDSTGCGVFGITAIAATILRPARTRPIRVFATGFALAFCVALIVCGSMPVPIWFLIATGLWLILILRNAAQPFLSSTSISPAILKVRHLLFWSSIVWLIAIITLELPYHLWRSQAEPVSHILVIGDSVTAGLNDSDDTWPRQLSRSAVVHIRDASQPGATLSSARQQNRLLAGHAGFVVLEIGGNDVLEGLPVAQFEDQLDQLLSDVVQSDRIVTMFELPLPPLCGAYGAVQRRQAKRHRVNLVPKRLFAAVLTTHGATIDGIHFSNSGQSQMMQLIRFLLGRQVQSGMGTYEKLERSSNALK